MVAVVSGGLFFEGVGGDVAPEAGSGGPESVLGHLGSMLACLTQPDDSPSSWFDVDQDGDWALVTAIVSRLDDQCPYPGTAVHLFRREGDAWRPVAGSSSAYLPQWERRSAGPPIGHHAAGQSERSYVVVDVRRDVASVIIGSDRRHRRVDVSGGPGLVGALFVPGDDTRLSSLDGDGHLMAEVAAETFA